MYARTAKLKRVKFLRCATEIIIFPIRLPIVLLYKLGELITNIFEIPLTWIETTYFSFEDKLNKRYGWDQIARDLYDEGKLK